MESGILGAALTAAGLALAYRVLQAPLAEVTALCVAPAVAFARGHAVFHLLGQGATLGCVHSPVQVLFYAVAGALSYPSSAMILATFMNLALVLLAAAVWLRAQERDGRLVAMAWVCLTFFLLSDPATATFIHETRVDGLGLGLSWLALAFLCRAAGRDRAVGWAAASAFCGAAAALTKISFVPVAAALWAAAFVFLGPRRGWKYGAFLLGSVAGLFCVGGLIFGFAAVVDVTWIQSLSAPWYGEIRTGEVAGPAKLFSRIKDVLKAKIEFARMALPWAVILATGLVLGWQRIRSRRAALAWFRARENAWWLPLAVGIFVLPPALIVRSKAGGAINSPGVPLAFLMLSTVSFGLSAAAGRVAWVSAAVARTAGMVVTAAAGILLVFFAAEWRGSAKGYEKNPADEAFFFLRAHPAKAFFPEYPVSTVLAENKLYHSEQALAEIHRWGIALFGGVRNVKAHLPERPEAIAVRWHGEIILPYYPGYTRLISLEGLSGWRIYAPEK